MGNCCSLFSKNKSKHKSITIILTGLDNSGKTTMAKKLIGEPVNNVLKTLGFSLIKLRHHNYDVNLYDLGGSSQIRGIWNKYYMDAHGIIYVVDSSDLSRLNEAKLVFADLLSHENVAGKPVLLLANKQDKENALDELEIVDQLNVEYIVNKYRSPTKVEICSALNSRTLKIDPNITRGYRWLISNIIENFKTIDNRVQLDMANFASLVQKDKAEWKRKKESEENGQIKTDAIHIKNGDPFKPIHSLIENGNISQSSENIDSVFTDPPKELKPDKNVFSKMSVTNLKEVVKEQKQKLNQSYHRHKKKFGRFNKTAPIPIDTIINEEPHSNTVRMISVKPCSSRSSKNTNFLQTRPKTAPSMLYPMKYRGAIWNLTPSVEGSSSTTNLFTISNELTENMPVDNLVSFF